MNDLIKRLRSEAKVAEAWEAPDVAALLNEAVDALERLTPTDEEKKTAQFNADQLEREGRTKTAALLRKYVLQEKQP